MSTKWGEVQAKLGWVAGINRDVVGTGDGGESVGMDFGVDLDGTRQHCAVVDVWVKHALAQDVDHATGDAIGFEVATVIELGYACGQRGAMGIDEAAAVAGDATRVGDDDVGFLSGDFHKSSQHTGVAAAYFVQDGRGWAALDQMGIAGDMATELGLYGFAAVVQNGALGLDVELLVLVMG